MGFLGRRCSPEVVRGDRTVGEWTFERLPLSTRLRAHHQLLASLLGTPRYSTGPIQTCRAVIYQLVLPRLTPLLPVPTSALGIPLYVPFPEMRPSTGLLSVLGLSLLLGVDAGPLAGRETLLLQNAQDAISLKYVSPIAAHRSGVSNP